MLLKINRLIRRHPWLACGNNQGRLDPWSLDAISPWTTWSQVVKGRTTGATWLRVVTPYPLGTWSRGGGTNRSIL